MKNRVFLLLLLLPLMATRSFAFYQQDGDTTVAENDTVAPDFTLTDQHGKTFKLSDHRGKVVVLNFWATWCAPCLHEIPGFINLQKELGPEGVQFVGVSLDEDGFDSVLPYAEKMGINYPLVIDDGTVVQKYGNIQSLPTTFVIDREGKVNSHAAGAINEEDLRPVLLSLLKSGTK